MDENRSKKTDLEVSNEFERLFDEIPEPETDEEIHAYLLEEGYDPKILKTRGLEFVNDLIANNWRFVSVEEIDEVAARIDSVPVRKKWNRDQLTAAIQRISTALASGGMQPSLAFRSLEELTDSDLATILQELEFKARTNGINLDLD